MVTYKEIASMIDHSLLNPALTDKEIIEGCKIALEYKVASVALFHALSSLRRVS